MEAKQNMETVPRKRIQMKRKLHLADEMAQKLCELFPNDETIAYSKYISAVCRFELGDFEGAHVGFDKARHLFHGLKLPIEKIKELETFMKFCLYNLKKESDFTSLDDYSVERVAETHETSEIVDLNSKLKFAMSKKQGRRSNCLSKIIQKTDKESKIFIFLQSLLFLDLSFKFTGDGKYEEADSFLNESKRNFELFKSSKDGLNNDTCGIVVSDDMMSKHSVSLADQNAKIKLLLVPNEGIDVLTPVSIRPIFYDLAFSEINTHTEVKEEKKSLTNMFSRLWKK